MAITETREMRVGGEKFAKSAMRAPMLSAEHEHHLARRWREHGDEAALHELTSAYIRLVVSMASKFRHYGLPANDLVQEGNVGLMQAAARFEPDRGVRFSTYATWWIRASIQDFVLRNWSIVRTGTTASQKSLFFNLRRLRAQIDDVGGRLAPEARTTIATKLRVAEADVDQMAARLSAQDRSLNAPTAEDADLTWQDALPDDREGPDDAAMHAHDARVRTQWIESALKALSPRELMIIKERKFTEEDGATLESIGQRLGISKERVRQIESVALRKLRQAMIQLAPNPVEAGLVG
ncbi:MAG: RNA polymerase factor sigma-32 [Alphaproteobacteria bacterium]|nr:RNA polymerase factor sigma-32 [Alphaproteobacteria bacterium]